MWKIWGVASNASRWQMGFNLVLKGLSPVTYCKITFHSAILQNFLLIQILKGFLENMMAVLQVSL